MDILAPAPPSASSPAPFEVQATAPPAAGTLERWAYDYVVGTDLAAKLAPPPAPRALEASPSARRLAQPGRPAALAARGRPRKTPSAEALRSPSRRAELMHTFLHHELQAAELFCWAILAFPETPAAFRRGLARLALDEARHMRLYAAYLASLGHAVGDFPVHDWFWERIPAAPDAPSFAAVMGLGFEAANLDHTARFAERFRAAGDEAGAALVEQVGREEIGHVRFAQRWFARFTGGLAFPAWRAALPPPLSPLLFRGRPIAREARLRAGLDAPFVDALEAWTPEW